MRSDHLIRVFKIIVDNQHFIEKYAVCTVVVEHADVAGGKIHLAFHRKVDVGLLVPPLVLKVDVYKRQVCALTIS